jgi:hypothetical protein
MSRRGPAWVVMGGTHGCGVCLRCGVSLELQMPMSLGRMAAKLQGFASRHGRCKEAVAPEGAEARLMDGVREEKR